MPSNAINPDLYFNQMFKQLQWQMQQLMTRRMSLLADSLGYSRAEWGPLTQDPNFDASSDLNPDGSVLGPSVWGFAVYARENYTTAPGTPGPSPYIAKMTEDGVFGPILDMGGEVFNVRAYGAAGDGVTDDTPAVVAAMAAAAAASPSGGTVVFGPGTYLVGQITVATPGMTFLLAAGASLLCGHTFTGAGAWFDVTAPNVTFCGLGIIDGNWANQDGNEVASICFEAATGGGNPGADNGTVMGLTIQDTGHGVLCHADNPRVTDCIFATCYFSPVDILYTSEPINGGLVRGNTIEMPDPNSAGWTRSSTATFTGINVQCNAFHGPTFATVGNCTITAGSAQITTTGNFETAGGTGVQPGMSANALGVPGPAQVVSVDSTTQVTLSEEANQDSTGQSVTFGVSASGSEGDTTATLLGYALATTDVGSWIEIVGAGGFSAQEIPLPNLLGVISEVDTGANTATIDGIGQFGYDFSGATVRIFPPVVNGIVIAENRIDYTSTNGSANGIGIQVFVATNCVIQGNRITALAGDRGGDNGSGQLISIAGGWGHNVVGNNLYANGTSTAIEADSSTTAYVGNTVVTEGNAEAIHCTSKNGLVQDVLIANNNLSQLYNSGQGATGFVVLFDNLSNGIGASNVAVLGNTLRMNPDISSPDLSAVVQVAAAGYRIDSNIIYCAGCIGVWTTVPGPNEGDVTGNRFYGANSIFHCSPENPPTIEIPMSDIRITGNRLAADCLTFSDAGDLPIDNTLQTAVAANADITLANVIFRDNPIQGVGRFVSGSSFLVPKQLTFSSSPHTYTNTNLYPVQLVIYGGEATGGASSTTDLVITLNGFNITGRTTGSFGIDAMGPLPVTLYPGDSVVMTWSGGLNPSAFVIPML